MVKAGILIVEDENIIALDLKSSLINLGYSVVGTAASGQDAIRKTNESHPDLILMDIMLKGEMDGIEAAEQILMRFDIPLVFVTAYANDAVLRRAKIIQPFGYILKPFRESELHTNIEIALYRHKMEKKLRRREIAARDELERRVKERTVQVMAANEKLRFLTSQLLSAQDKERKRISLELHDGLGQSLTVLKLQLRQLERKLSEMPEEQQECHKSLTFINEIIEHVRHLSRELSPSILEDLGLDEALSHLFKEFGKYQDLEVSVERDEIKDLIPAEAHIAIYRIFQESLNNISKHSRATQMKVAIKEHSSFVKFSIEDNGQGFDLKEIQGCGAEDRGMGLAAMDERVRILGGDLKIASIKGIGTNIAFTIPINPQRQ